MAEQVLNFGDSIPLSHWTVTSNPLVPAYPGRHRESPSLDTQKIRNGTSAVLSFLSEAHRMKPLVV